MLAAGISKTRNSWLLGKATLIQEKCAKEKKQLNNSIQAYKINILSEQEHFVLDFSPPLPPPTSGVIPSAQVPKIRVTQIRAEDWEG
jgi:hypothetical protein